MDVYELDEGEVFRLAQLARCWNRLMNLMPGAVDPGQVGGNGYSKN
jgi:hypothetical protein